MENIKIVYVADIGGDIDDVVAIEYLHNQNALHCVVLDGYSSDQKNQSYLEQKGILIVDQIPEGTTTIFCGGALTKINEYLETNSLELLVMNGFFAGANVVPSENQLEKFRGWVSGPSFNPNLDRRAAEGVLQKAFKIKTVIVVSKDVCHHPDNVKDKWHRDLPIPSWIKPTKKLHDLLMCREGLSFLRGEKQKCSYTSVRISHLKDHSGIKWFSNFDPDSNIYISIGYIG